MSFNILVVDDEASMRNSLARLLTGNGYSVRVADCARAALGKVRKEHPDLVLLDICLPDTSGLDVLRQLKEINDRIEVIAMTAYESVADAVQAIKIGAYDYLGKPFNIDAIRLLIKRALANRYVEKAGGPRRPVQWQGSACDRLIGKSPAMKRVLDIIHRLPANSVSNVLAEGETGTGKELAARAIHETSGRAAEPFVAVSCAAIPRDLMESELFGYEGGAFTGARPGGKPGVFERAGNGTVFLDEIGELELALQVKLLRVLEAREFCRVGGLKSIPLRARIIAATNRDLKREVKEGRFRADVYYRLNVVLMTLPPLREHPGDVAILAESFMQEFSARFSRKFAAISQPARKLLENYAWPGNVRELRNVMERIVLMEDGCTILPEHLPDEILNSTPPETRLAPDGGLPGGSPLDDVERKCIVQALDRTGGNVVRAARLLGLKRGALRYRMDKYGI
ncbi:MAG: sigma-54-dependent Fis family transcriptional regulator [Planctomycetota bacterium]|nr:MAG: sigma-54-dependent Fis family transcriptional regulator [Planctomycetota bacterium]